MSKVPFVLIFLLILGLVACFLQLQGAAAAVLLLRVWLVWWWERVV
jgi:F0F1-type ATP synthase assembly protein I